MRRPRAPAGGKRARLPAVTKGSLVETKENTMTGHAEARRPTCFLTGCLTAAAMFAACLADGSFHTRRTVTSATAIATFSDDSMLQHDSYGHHMLTAQCEAVYCLRKIEMSACPNQHPV